MIVCYIRITTLLILSTLATSTADSKFSTPPILIFGKIKNATAVSCKDGMCLPTRNCKDVMGHRSQTAHKMCVWDKKRDIVCCEARNAHGRAKAPNNYVSTGEQKCLEYNVNEINGEVSLTRTQRSGSDNPVRLIINGEDAYELEFPHMALLGYRRENNVKWLCGGTLISKKFVLTAAHCIHTLYGTVTYVVLGLRRISNMFDNAKRYDVKDTKVHPSFNIYERYYDIGLVELQGVVDFNDKIKPACLQTDRDINHPILVATGWGATEIEGGNSDVLQKVNLTYVPSNKCVRFYPPQIILSDGIQDEQHICAGSLHPDKDTCQGDSGGPLQYRNSTNELYTVAGITSFGRSCGQLPAIYTRVSNFIPWIAEVVWSK